MLLGCLSVFLFMVTIKRWLVREEVSSIKEKDIEVFVAVMFAWISERVVRVRMFVFFCVKLPYK